MKQEFSVRDIWAGRVSSGVATLYKKANALLDEHVVDSKDIDGVIYKADAASANENTDK